MPGSDAQLRSRAVDGVDFTVAPGELFGLLGPNGAGKTTTIRILTTLIPADSGTARIFGLDVRREPMRVRRALGCVPQQLSADGGLTGYEKVWLFARLFDVPRREREGRIPLPRLPGAGHHGPVRPLYPVELMPGWLRGLSMVNPLSYELDALRGMLLGTPSSLALDLVVLVAATVASVAVAASLLDRLAR